MTGGQGRGCRRTEQRRPTGDGAGGGGRCGDEAPTFPLQKALISSAVVFSPFLSRMQAQISSPIRLSFTPTTFQGQRQRQTSPSASPSMPPAPGGLA